MMKSRFCPSPTGWMHMGNVRTALFNALLANGMKGTFLLRIEDTDKTRSTDEFAHVLQDDLKWLGLHWQEGPGVEGSAGPYWQSKRQAIYDIYYQKLADAGHVYPCFCSDQQLAIARKVQLASGQPPRYAGTCRALTPEQIQERIAQGQQPTLRFKIPENGTVRFHDFVRGEQVFRTQDIGDFIIRRADGTASFMYCNAIDDALMGVTHALRGEDHLTNTPRQLLILQALGLPAPSYGHISMIVGSDGSPLSKRHGSKSIKELREEGYFPIALINYMARLGHYYESNKLMSFDELSSHFSTQALGAAPARYDGAQLLYWQKEAVQGADTEELWQWLGTKLHTIVPIDLKELFVTTIRGNITFPNDAHKWAERFFIKDIAYSEAIENVLKTVDKQFFTIASKAIAEGLGYKELCAKLQADLCVKGKSLFLPLRAALTGELTGPEMEPIIALLGKEAVLFRFAKAQECFAKV